MTEPPGMAVRRLANAFDGVDAIDEPMPEPTRLELEWLAWNRGVELDYRDLHGFEGDDA